MRWVIFALFLALLKLSSQGLGSAPAVGMAAGVAIGSVGIAPLKGVMIGVCAGIDR